MNVTEIFGTEIGQWLVIPGLIFFARIVDVSMGTLRIIFVSRGNRYLAPALGFFEVLIWLIAIGQIMQNLTNPLNYLAYAAGFAAGNYAGIILEKRIATGIVLIRVITRKEASELIEQLRKSGLTVTSIEAEGNRGPVKVFFTVVRRRNIKEVVETIKKYNPRAFYTIEDISFVHYGLIPSIKTRRRLIEWLGQKRK